ncbi:MAG: hypothetical protein HY697_02175 [Deltaproteobacteria bacterium]|nr:hypothetical protein [Deltaproteobacteria bacterium]
MALIGASEVLLFAGVPFVGTYFTPLVWTGYLFFIDGLVQKAGRASPIFRRTKDFLFLLLLSIGFWLIFEFYNLFIRNWSYVGLPENPVARYTGYAWAFATIWPAILLTEEALEARGVFAGRRIRPFRLGRPTLLLSLIFGIFCLLLPLAVPPDLARYLATPVWLGFIFFLDPLNYWLGGASLFRELEEGRPGRIWRLLLAGFICGGLWEFWNFWAEAKWHYTVPILGEVKIFEMPVLGYLGFPPFALECFTMYAFVRRLTSGPLAIRDG